MSVKQLSKRLTALILMLTLTACLKAPTASETTNAVFGALGETLPTASRQDTPQTKREIGVHRKVFFDLCAELKAACVE